MKFILFPLGISVPFLFSIFIGLTLCVPFMAYYYVRMYRNMVCGGTISFLHAWIFTVFMYMFAALLTAVAHYIYIRFIDQGFILNSYETMLNSWEITYKAVPGIDAYIEQLREGLSQVRSLTPIEITMQMMSMNVFVGAVVAGGEGMLRLILDLGIEAHRLHRGYHTSQPHHIRVIGVADGLKLHTGADEPFQLGKAFESDRLSLLF